MNRNLLMPVAVSMILLSGCKYNDDNFEGLDEMSQPTNLKKIEYTLTDADYEAISSNATNKKIAGNEFYKDLANVKTNKYLTENITGATYIPAFLLGKYFSADNGSSAIITYKYKEAMSSLLSEYASVKYLMPTNADYKLVYGENAFAPYLNEATEGKMYKILDENFKDAEKGTVVFVDYKSGEEQLENPLMWQNFDELPVGNLTELNDWSINSIGGTEWKVTSYNGNQYVQYSANRMKGECEAWMVTPAVSVVNGDFLGFDVAVGYYNANCLSVLISEDFDGKAENIKSATWTDITSQFSLPTMPTSGFGTLASAGKVSLSDYAGKNVYVAFKYLGDGANRKTTTYQIDNIMIGTSIPQNSVSTPAYAVKVYDGKSWKDTKNNVYVPTYTDYADMGQGKRYFTSDVPAENYLPVYLSKMVAYPVDGDVSVVVYRYNNGKELQIRSDEYTYSAEASKWSLNTRIVDRTEQFVLSDGKWNFDPSTVITLKAEKGNVETAAFYQAITDYVKENHSEYVTSYGNNDYYYGGSAYNNNFDFRPSAWRAQNAAAYASMSDEQLKALMFERLPEAFVPALQSIYGNADVVEGVDVYYTIIFSIYDGSVTTAYTIKYKVTGLGQFEYVQDSLMKVE